MCVCLSLLLIDKYVAIVSASSYHLRKISATKTNINDTLWLICYLAIENC